MDKNKILKYSLVFLLTTLIFLTASYINAIINEKKFINLRSAQDQVSVEMLTSETKFDPSKDINCHQEESVVFSNNLEKIADKITFAEQNVGTAEDIIALKKQYTLLQIRDYLLTKRAGEQCNNVPTTIFYFYDTKAKCTDCVRQGYVLDALHQSRPSIKVYAFDSNLDLETIKSLRSAYGINDVIPAVVINGVTYNGYQSLDRLLTIIPE